MESQEVDAATKLGAYFGLSSSLVEDGVGGSKTMLDSEALSSRLCELITTSSSDPRETHTFSEICTLLAENPQLTCMLDAGETLPSILDSILSTSVDMPFLARCICSECDVRDVMMALKEWFSVFSFSGSSVDNVYKEEQGPFQLFLELFLLGLGRVRPQSVMRQLGDLLPLLRHGLAEEAAFEVPIFPSIAPHIAEFLAGLLLQEGGALVKSKSLQTKATEQLKVLEELCIETFHLLLSLAAGTPSDQLKSLQKETDQAKECVLAMVMPSTGNQSGGVLHKLAWKGFCSEENQAKYWSLAVFIARNDLAIVRTSSSGHALPGLPCKLLSALCAAQLALSAPNIQHTVAQLCQDVIEKTVLSVSRLPCETKLEVARAAPPSRIPLSFVLASCLDHGRCSDPEQCRLLKTLPKLLSSCAVPSRPRHPSRSTPFQMLAFHSICLLGCCRFADIKEMHHLISKTCGSDEELKFSLMRHALKCPFRRSCTPADKTLCSVPWFQLVGEEVISKIQCNQERLSLNQSVEEIFQEMADSQSEWDTNTSDRKLGFLRLFKSLLISNRGKKVAENNPRSSAVFLSDRSLDLIVCLCDEYLHTLHPYEKKEPKRDCPSNVLQEWRFCIR